MGASLFTLSLQGRLDDYMRADAKAMPKVHTLTVRAAGGRTKRAIVKQIDTAFEGKQFRNAIKLKSDPPRGFSATTTVRVYSKARYQGKGTRRQAFDLLEVYSRDDTVKAAGHAYLAIPTENVAMRGGAGAGRGGAQRQASPRDCGVPLVFLKTADPNKAVLVTKPKGGARPVVMYVLLRQTIRRARLTPDAAHEASLARVAADFARYWAREDAATEAKFGRGLGEGA